MIIKYERMIQTAPYEGVHLVVEEEIPPGQDMAEVRKALDRIVDPWEQHIRKHYLIRPEKRMFQGREAKPTTAKQKPTDRMGRRVHEDSKNYYLSLKKEDTQGFYALQKVAKTQGVSDPTMWTLEEIEKEYGKILERRG